MLATGSLVAAAGCSNGEAQDEENEAAVPVEIYTCNYNDGYGPADLDATAAKWNAWADGRGVTDYTAWTMSPYYFGPDQLFDFIWLGVTPDAKALGRAQDNWLAHGGEVAAEFATISTCDAHSNFAAVQFKEPPDREDPSSVVLTFSDCKIAEGKSFGQDIAPALGAWAEYRTGHGSDAGMWVFFPVYGGGGSEFDFKWVVSHANYEALGADYDQYGQAGRHKDRELFADILDCDDARAYNLTNRRQAEEEE
jgi:hypothetical protein